ncbi:YraN family protein [Desulfobulbus alkaliphilus]|uniref:YraN family protein n=1 Tax=Desulfobulbus alkaliphilus TaxID=869814 RepID=UPI00308444F8
MGKKETSVGTGQLGERIAAEYLTGQRYEILETNYRKPFGEMDIIAKDQGVVVFIEVKTRHVSAFCATALEAVDVRKQRRLSRIAREYLLSRRLDDVPARFDVIAIVLNQKNQADKIEHIRDAFDCCG